MKWMQRVVVWFARDERSLSLRRAGSLLTQNLLSHRITYC